MRYIDMNERELIESLHRNEARRVRALRQRDLAMSDHFDARCQMIARLLGERVAERIEPKGAA
jgi:hypothetical protein